MPRLYILLTLLLAFSLVTGGSVVYADSVPTDHSRLDLRGACAALTTSFYASPECDAEMTADPAPPVVALAVDHGAMAGYTYMRVVVEGAVMVHNAPYGSPLYVLDPGFNFITPRTVQEHWVEINPGEWVRRDQLAFVSPSVFTGAFVQSEPSRPFGWFLKNLYASDRPGGPPVITPDKLLYRYQITYIYTTINVDGLDWYLVAPGKWVEQRLMGLAKRIPRPGGVQGRWVAVDLYEQTLVAYENDTMVFATLVSSGLAGFSTNTGTFQVWGHRLNGPMSGAEGQSDYYMLENVPYALYFDGNISLHGTYWHDGFGYRRSHGCVNLSITDAHWLYDWLGAGGGVHVYYSRPY
ncbi:MAG: L,D-transpeptidase [Anaerolineae bacterium]|nr:L,D-transpeptidase [Anaerolineae bacterium]